MQNLQTQSFFVAIKRKEREEGRAFQTQKRSTTGNFLFARTFQSKLTILRNRVKQKNDFLLIS